MQTQILEWPYCLLFWSPDCMDLLHFQTCKTWILPFEERFNSMYILGTRVIICVYFA